MTAIWNSWSDFYWTGKDENAQIALDVIMTEWDFEKAVKLKFKQGRPFSLNYKTDSIGVILNETALKMIGYKDPIGKTIKSGTQDLIITGVIEDVMVKDPFRPVSPTVILFNSGSANSFVYLRLKPESSLKTAIAAIQPIFEKHNPSNAFEYSFADEEFEKKFTQENQAGKLAGIFAVLAIFISCLGLFGLAAFMAERRTKEIGIRKVLGASLINLWTLLSKEFVLLVLAGCLIASPIAFWLMNGWLQSYDYRISIHWWVFILAALAALIIALLTVSSQAIRVSVMNPVKSLRSE
jgi:ABC-type antimicrobial peptide transport system permease subunit